MFFLILILGFSFFIFDNFTFIKSKVSKVVSKDKFNNKSEIEIKLEYFIFNKIKISKERENELFINLNILNMDISPKKHIVETLTKGILYGSLFVILGVCFQSLPVILLSLLVSYGYYYVTYKKLKDASILVRTSIEKELPKLCSVISSKLIHTNNVENILKAYYPIATDKMQTQLNITLADMHSSNVFSALTRLENRIHSQKLSDVTRGLISVSNGNDGRIYFESKAIEFRNVYKNIIKLEVQKRPAKILPMQIFIGLFFVFILMQPILTYLTQTQNSIIN